ncbi:MAG: hypothetical protein ACHQ1D_07435 [Nitrososphaerales archaeon]
MKYLTFLSTIGLLLVFSCSRDKQLDDYTQIVDSADKIVFYERHADTFSITMSVDSLEHLQNLKNILKRNIKPEYQRKFIAQRKIEIYKHQKLLGVLLISGTNEDPFVNFTNDTFGFGFKLTYGIGMSF